METTQIAHKFSPQDKVLFPHEMYIYEGEITGLRFEFGFEEDDDWHIEYEISRKEVGGRTETYIRSEENVIKQ